MASPMANLDDNLGLSNWLTSKVSVHSLCKGQAIALQMPKENSQMMKNPFTFLMRYFYNPPKVFQGIIHSHRIPPLEEISTQNGPPKMN